MPVHGASEQRRHKHGVTGASWGKGVLGQGQVLGTGGRSPTGQAGCAGGRQGALGTGRVCLGQAGRAGTAMQACCPQDVGRAQAQPWCRTCSPHHTVGVSRPSPVPDAFEAVGSIFSQAHGGHEQSPGVSVLRGDGAALLPLNYTYGRYLNGL